MTKPTATPVGDATCLMKGHKVVVTISKSGFLNYVCNECPHQYFSRGRADSLNLARKITKWRDGKRALVLGADAKEIETKPEPKPEPVTTHNPPAPQPAAKKPAPRPAPKPAAKAPEPKPEVKKVSLWDKPII